MMSRRILPMTVRPTHPDQVHTDWMAVACLLLAVVGLLLKHKLAAWLALFASLASLANMKKRESDLKQLSSSCVFAIVSHRCSTLPLSLSLCLFCSMSSALTPICLLCCLHTDGS